MFGAGPYVEEAFDIPESEARELLIGWMKAYSKTWDGDNHEFIEAK